MEATLTVGELYKRLVLDPPRTYPEFYQEVKDLLLMAKDDYPKYPLMGKGEPWSHREYNAWFRKWFGSYLNQLSIETLKAESVREQVIEDLDETLEKLEDVDK